MYNRSNKTMIKKINLSDINQVREKILSAVEKVNDLVSITLGPDGLSALIERGMGEPLMVDDGRRTAENIKFDDSVEQLIARVLYAVTKKTDEKVGDGTTTSMILAHAIIEEVFKKYLSCEGMNLGNMASVSEIDEKIQESKKNILKLIDDKTTKIKTEKQLIDVATIAAGNSRIGEIIGKMYWKLGEDGHLTLEFNLLSEELETRLVPGYKFLGGYAAPWMITNEIRQHSILKEVDVLVAYQFNLEVEDVQPLAKEVASAGKTELVIIAPKFSEPFLKNVYLTAVKGRFSILCITAPRKEGVYKDIATLTGGKYFSKNDDLKKAFRKDLGRVKEVEVTEDCAILVEGAGSKEDIKKRIKEVKADEKHQKLHQFKASRLERISGLAGYVGLIRIGAPTDEERNWLKYKIEDAKYATKWAYKGGIVKGGGMAYKEISDSLPDDDILKEPLLAPYKKLKQNAGRKFKVGKDVIDPAPVEKAALEYACSAASKLIRIGGAVAIQPKSDIELALKDLVQKDE